jgi:hypothetical protein
MLDDNNGRESERWVDCGRSYPPLSRSTNLGKPHQPCAATNSPWPLNAKTDLWRGSNFAHHRLVMIELLPKLPGPSPASHVADKSMTGTLLRLQTDRPTDRQTKMVVQIHRQRVCWSSEGITRNCKIAGSFGYRICCCSFMSSPFRIGLDGENFEGEIMSHAIQGKFWSLSSLCHAGLGFRV